MKRLDLPEIDRFRVLVPAIGSKGDENCGAFMLRDGLRVIASNAEGWDHVSVSYGDHTPSWDDMEYVKRLFFKDDETAMQLHVPPADHINCHPYVLHLWRPHDAPIPRPPGIMVGPK
jgi:hypothetical protein